MTTTPSRQPKGRPTGGQFAAKSNPEPSDDELGRPLSDRFHWKRTDDVVAYTYKADIVCPSCMLKAVPTPHPPTHSAESALDIAATEIGIDRYDESTFDSNEFPKVLFRDQIADGDACCDCGQAF